MVFVFVEALKGELNIQISIQWCKNVDKNLSKAGKNINYKKAQYISSAQCKPNIKLFISSVHIL